MNNLYRELYRRSLDYPESFWQEAARQLHWYREPSIIHEHSNSNLGQWFADGEINACYNAIDRHVAAGNGNRTALIYDSPVSKTTGTFSFETMQEQVSRIAGMLAAEGVTVGDRVVIYMPMIPEAIMSMLACARIGAIHSVVFGGFAANELAKRIDDAGPKVILSASCGIEVNRIIEYGPLLVEAVTLAQNKPSRCIILQREQAHAVLNGEVYRDWQQAYSNASPVDCVPVPSTHPLYILYTSGTTGKPKGVVHDTGAYLTALQWSMINIYACDPGDVYWAASDVGWVVGHSYITYGPLVNGTTSVIFEGKPVGTPDAGAFWRLISEHHVKVMFTAPTAFRAIKKEDPDGVLIKQYDLSSLEALFLAGERCDPDTLDWARDKLGIPVIDHWWQTETGWAICANCRGIELLPVKPGSSTLPVPGFDVHVLGQDKQALEPGNLGALAIKLPLPPGVFTTLWNNNDLFREAYFSNYPGYYETGDAGYIDEDGYVFVMTRTDDVINTAGHRLSTGAIEEVLSAHADIAECAVIGAADDTKGQVPVGLVVLKSGAIAKEEEICRQAVALVRSKIGPVAAFKSCAVVGRLPKTRSGKILRGTMRKMADAEEWTTPATIDDATVLDEIGEALKTLGYGS